MRLLIMGAPGAGKGTQAGLIKENYPIAHISTGDMFREAIRNGTKLGKLAASYINQGSFVPDDVTIGLVEERLTRPDCSSGYLLDGFPRNLVQVEAFDQLSKKISRPIELVLNISVDKSALINRITGRRVCPKCGNSYHISFRSPRTEGICDSCGSTLVQRKDDTAESLKVRIDEYENQTKPLIDYYEKKGLVKTVDGLKDIDKVFEDILSILKGEN